LRKFDDEFLIDGLPVLLPDEGVRIEPEDIFASESGQDESGYMHIIPLRNDVLKFTLNYRFITIDEYRYMESLFKGKTTFSAEFRKLDGEVETRTCYRPRLPAPSLRNRRVGNYDGYTLIIKEC
jgi:hypothetical protein